MPWIQSCLPVLLLTALLTNPSPAGVVKDPCPVHEKHRCSVEAIAFGQPTANDWKNFEKCFDSAKTLAASRKEIWTRTYSANPIPGTFKPNGPDPFNYCGETGHGLTDNKLGVRTSISYDPGSTTPAPDVQWSQVVNGQQFDPDAFRPEYPRDGFPNKPTWFGDMPCHDCLDGWTETFMTIAMIRTPDPANPKKVSYSFDKSHAYTWGYKIHCTPVPLPTSASLALSILLPLAALRLFRSKAPAH